MRIKHQDIEIPDDDAFKNCKLERKVYGEILTDIIDSYSEGFVLAIDSKWGTGKTTFVKMWQKHLENKKYKTLYFNAWVNDFDSNPLVAILAELKTLISSDNNSAFKSLLSKGAVITQKMLPSLIKAIAEKYIDTKVLTEAIENFSESAVEILKDEINEYTNKKKGLIDFKVELESFVKKNTNGTPLIFIIDELDRCRPNYSVEVLEQIKHFFNVPGIVFVLAIDKTQLCNAIRGFYGSDRIDSDEYLRRFIDIEYNIPQPQTGIFCKYLYDYFQFDIFFSSSERIKYGELKNDKASFIKIASSLFDQGNITLRQQAKIFAHSRLVLNMFNPNSYVFPTIYFLLIYIRDTRRDFYQNIVNKKLTSQEVINKLGELFPKNLDEYALTDFIYIEARFVKYYDNYIKDDYASPTLIRRNDKTGEDELLVQSGFNYSNANTTLLNALKSFRSTDANNFKLSSLLLKIDLLENINK